ncbi:hypothetical protein BC834DRAFT_966556 [Gloeopeniophorella convolvens]|nr:hypothetical protein BC834DRAFT_966556 [Gloeopeniophorella convolvens]
MGFSGNYCTFCGGPPTNTYDDWRDLLETWPPKDDGRWVPYPTKSRKETIRITKEDGAFWEDGTIVAQRWEDSEFVCPVKTHCPFNVPEVDGDTSWWDDDDSHPYLIIHRQCLSYVCRRLNTTPSEMWKAMFPVHHLRVSNWHPEWPDLEYLEMERRQGQEFIFAVDYMVVPPDGGKATFHMDTNSMEECEWLLARPTVFPKLQPASGPEILEFSLSASVPPILRVMRINELFTSIFSLIETSAPTDPASIRPVINADNLSSFTGLLRSCKAFYALLSARQDIYFKFVVDSGWMLPATPSDWSEWKAAGNPSSISLGQWDWKTYLKAFVLREDRHIRNRWRFERMLAQLALPTRFVRSKDELWSLGEYPRPCDLIEPETIWWEEPPEGSSEDEEEESEEEDSD